MVNIGATQEGRGQSAEHLSFFPVTTGKCSDHSKVPGRRQDSPCRLVCPSLTGTGVSIMLNTPSHHALSLQLPDRSGLCCLLQKTIAWTSSREGGARGCTVHICSPGDNSSITLPGEYPQILWGPHSPRAIQTQS